MTTKKQVIDDLKVARALVEKAKREGISLSVPEQDFVQDAVDAADDLATDEKTAALDAITKAGGAASTPSGRGFLAPQVKSTAKRFVGPPESKTYKSDFDRYIKFGQQSDGLIEHKADLAEGANATGGYLVPEAYNDALIATIAAASPMFELTRQVQTTSDTFHAPNVASIGNAGWTAEASAFTAGDDTFGDTPITVFKCTRITKVSEEILQDNAFDLESWLAESFGRAFGALINTALTVGTGGVQPFGIVTRGTAVTTTGGTSSVTSWTSDDLLSVFFALAPQFRSGASFQMSDTTVHAVRSLKDTTGQYLFQPGLQAGEPAQLLGRPLYTNPDVPAVGTAATSIVFGDVQRAYTTALNASITIQRMNELYAATGQVGFRGFVRLGGDVTLTAAYVVGKNHA